MASGAPLDLAGRLVQGTCGWGSPHQHLSVYPASCRSAEDRLEIYSRHFGAVEVDSTCYAIPSAKVVERWVARVPPGFAFLFKAFGAFCASSVDVASLPRSTRALLGSSSDEDHLKTHVSYARMPEPARADLWNAFHACLAPAKRANKLACVVFQFHTSFAVSPSNRRKVEELRNRLDREIRMAVEFRDRAWIARGETGDETVRWCARLDLALVASDELAHETAQPDRAQTGLPPGQKRTVMPTRLVASASWGAVASRAPPTRRRRARARAERDRAVGGEDRGDSSDVAEKGNADVRDVGHGLPGRAFAKRGGAVGSGARRGAARLGGGAEKQGADEPERRRGALRSKRGDSEDSEDSGDFSS